MPDKPDSFVVPTDELAATADHRGTQPRAAWPFEVEAAVRRDLVTFCCSRYDVV
jgi:hypothetical protein